MINLDRYCVRCDSDQHVALSPSGQQGWCSVCWDWQLRLPPRIIALLRDKS